MNYQNYEEYMQSVLGYQPMNQDIYNNDTYNQNYYYNLPYKNNFNNNQNTEILNALYPEIYVIIYPMICKICNRNLGKQITKELIEQMTDEIYRNVEPEDTLESSNQRLQLKNGDVRNPNSKEVEVRQGTRIGNQTLRDLIQILIIRELLKQNRPPMFQPRPPIMQRPNNFWN